MNSIQFNNNKINFKATPDEIKSIQKACFNLANSPAKNNHKVSVDVAEIGNKAYISTLNKGGQSLVKIELKNDKGANAYTMLKTGTPEATKKFFNMPKSIEKIVDIIDDLKETVKKTTAADFYTDF